MNSKAVATNVCSDLPPLIDIHPDCSFCTIGWPMDGGWLRVSFWGPECKQYWAVNNNGKSECVHSVSAPANAIAGPFYWAETCASHRISTDPYWCLNSDVSQSPTRPNECATGPYATFQDAIAACPDSAVTRYPSMWIMGTDVAWGNFKCVQPGDDHEPNPSIWACEYVVDQFRIRAQIVPEMNDGKPTGGIVVGVFVSRMGPRSIWMSYCSFSTTIQEDPCTAAVGLPWRRRWFRSGYVPVSVNAEGGLGDPVSAAKVEATLTGMKLGCGYPNEWEIEPVCGFGDGTGWYTCFRAHVDAPYYDSLNPALPGVLFPLGVRSIPANNPQNPSQIYFAECDTIYRNQNGQWATRYNASNGSANTAFIATYQKIGSAGRAPQEFIDLENSDTLSQQIQIEDKDKLCLKSFGSQGILWLGYRNPITEEWEVVKPTKVQPVGDETGKHLHIWVASFPLSSVTVHLYAMRFPSASILPEACGGLKVQPWKWYCVNNQCLASDHALEGATGGPYDTVDECKAACQPPPPQKKWYCVDGVCGEYASAPAGATSGPHDTKEACEADCQAPPSDPWWCLNGSCVQSATQPEGSTGPHASQSDCHAACSPPENIVWVCNDRHTCVPMDKVWADEHGVGYWDTEELCNQNCTAPVWVCLNGTCVSMSAEDATLGGHQYWGSLTDCNINCQTPTNPYQGYYCVPQTNPGRGAGTPYTCIQWGGTQGPPAGATGGKYTSLEDCVAGCAGSPDPEEPGIPYWCVEAADGSRACARAVTAPPATLSGPYLTQAECDAACQMSIAPVRSVLPEQENRTATSKMALINMVLKSPCAHLGASKGQRKMDCRCGYVEVFECKKHGECTRIIEGLTGVIACVNCGDYESKV